MPHAQAQRHPCDGGASGTAVAGLAATPTLSNYLHIYIFRQFRKSAPGEHLNALRGTRISSFQTKIFAQTPLYQTLQQKRRIQDANFRPKVIEWDDVSSSSSDEGGGSATAQSIA